jgi:hypothetical protein
MFLLSVIFALITVGLSVMLYAYLTWSDPDVNWVSDSRYTFVVIAERATSFSPCLPHASPLCY